MGLKLQHKVLRSGLPRHRFIASVLALFGDDDGTNIFPGVKRIVEYTGESRATVFRALKYLLSIGVIVVDRQGGGRNRTTIYKMVEAALPERQSGTTKGLTSETVSATAKGLTSDTVSAETVSPDAAASAETVSFGPSETVSFEAPCTTRRSTTRRSAQPTRETTILSPAAPPTRDGQEGQNAKSAPARCVEAFYDAYIAKHDLAPMRKAKNAALILPLVHAYGEERVLALIALAFNEAYHLFAHTNQDVAAFVQVAPKINVMEHAPALSRKMLDNLRAAAGAMGRPTTSAVPLLLLPEPTKKENS